MIKEVIIEEDCTACFACQEACPKVFKVSIETMRSEIIEGANFEENAADIKAAVKACPVSVIKIKEK